MLTRTLHAYTYRCWSGTRILMFLLDIVLNISSAVEYMLFLELLHMCLGFLLLLLVYCLEEFLNFFSRYRPTRGNACNIFGSASCLHRMHEIWWSYLRNVSIAEISVCKIICYWFSRWQLICPFMYFYWIFDIGATNGTSLIGGSSVMENRKWC